MIQSEDLEGEGVEALVILAEVGADQGFDRFGGGHWLLAEGRWAGWRRRGGIWGVTGGKWEVGSGKWEVGSGKWEVGFVKNRHDFYRRQQR